ncbi:NADH dehydrogenase [ubiquinone] 1 alpha subcomplex subunit 10, mitochondrial-like [Saccoglossus kowalevskii]|uniref:NADH dehydrogenase [ubiquinone] 1 alpha subcomplex subunit 10, mitochondrial n=1 Tax=Saccoglossus kowalevskii TaxID=10224 RepID=A0ABM0GX02_SACKO|nr:PREDICTED: NADH dehydrogenase [ubiquinone] 1 alpha subcomplex subunit 10, mitochondrial-like [Saccoglossus kowalevskii]
MALLIGRCRLGVTKSSPLVSVLRCQNGADSCKMAAAAGVGAQKFKKFHTSSIDLKKYSWLNYILGERTLKRFNDRSKIIVIDGNIAAGKTTLGQKLAKELGMYYFPEASLDYFDRQSGDGKRLDPKFTGNVSLERFYKDPKAEDGHSFRLQVVMYMIRYLTYCDAMNHLLTTGEGVILDRSVYSDFVFLEAITTAGLIRKQCYDYYQELKGISLWRVLPPHLVIYLDAPLDVVKKRIKERGIPYEQTIDDSYLESIDRAYTKQFLPEIGESSEILHYDWTNFGEIERVLEDIDMLKYEKSPWNDQDDVSLHHYRVFFNNKFHVVAKTIMAKYLPELTVGALEFDEIRQEYLELPGMRYQKGYNKEDGNLIFK